MRRPTSPLLLAGLLLTMAQAWAANGQPAEAWLQRMAGAMRNTNYTGTFVYRHGGELETLRIVHRSSASGERERLFSLNGVAREVLRDGDKVTCILPDSRTVHVDWRQTRNPLSDLVAAGTSRIGTGYSIELGESGRVAGRAAQRIRVEPRDGFRYGYELWIDRKTGLLLRSDLLNAAGRPVEQIMFTELEVWDEIPDSWLKPALSGEGLTWFDPAAPEVSAQPVKTWQVADLPPGFTPVLRKRHPAPDGTGSIEHYLFSDGLASVSLYVEAADETSQIFAGRSSMGAVHAYGRMLNGYQVIVVGEVPAVTVERIARSVRRGDGEGSS